MNTRQHTPTPTRRRAAERRVAPRRLILATLVATGFAGCTKMVATYNRYMQQEIVATGNWELDVEAQLANGGVSGQVLVDGCLNPATVQAMQATQGVAPPTNQSSCQRFPVGDALVRVVVGDVEVSRRTELNGQFVIASGSELARLTGAGTVGEVRAEYYGREAVTVLRFGALDEVAALAVLDEAQIVTVPALVDFIEDWRGTDAADLAMDRYGHIACDEFQADWSELMASGDVSRANEIADTYDDAWRESFCGHCRAECAAMDALADISSELGSVGR